MSNNLSSKVNAISLSHYHSNRNGTFKWLEHVRNILISCGFSGIWDNHVFPNSLPFTFCLYIIYFTHKKTHKKTLLILIVLSGSNSKDRTLVHEYFYVCYIRYRIRNVQIKARVNTKLPVFIYIICLRILKND